MFRRVAGLPVLPRLDLAAQRRRAMSRCHRRIVSGVTSSRSPCRSAFGITASRVARSAWSAQFSFGRRGCCCRTASWWRRIKISAVFHVSSRRASRSHAASRVVRRNMNRRHMTDDHHGRTVGRANPAGQGPWTTFSARTGVACGWGDQLTVKGLRSRWPVTLAVVGVVVAGGAAAVGKWPHAWWWLVVATAATAAVMPPALTAISQASQRRKEIARTAPAGLQVATGSGRRTLPSVGTPT